MTRLHHVDDAVTVWHGDCIEVLRTLPDCSIDAVVTDPPYGIGFMGKAWDQPGEYGSTKRIGTPGIHRRGRGRAAERAGDGGAMDAGRYDFTANARFQAWCEAWATECLRVLKPGGHLAAFGSTRTYHRLAAGIEDAGFEIRDTLAWMFGSGFPKSLDVARAIDRAAGSEGSWRREDHAGRIGARTTPGALLGQTDSRSPDNPEGLRHVYEPAEAGAPWEGWGTALKPAYEPIVLARKPLRGTVAANVLAHGTGALNIDASRIEANGRPLISGDGGGPSVGVYGDVLHGSRNLGTTDQGRWPANVLLDEDAARLVDHASGERPAGGNLTGSEPSRPFQDVYGDMDGRRVWESYADTGGASRFFYTAKAGRDERPVVDGVAHPTVKPLDLMQWLIRLITPPGGRVLDPFAGSGTTAEACVIEGFRCTTIEREATYLPLIVHRLTKPTGIQQVLA